MSYKTQRAVLKSDYMALKSPLIKSNTLKPVLYQVHCHGSFPCSPSKALWSSQNRNKTHLDPVEEHLIWAGHSEVRPRNNQPSASCSAPAKHEDTNTLTNNSSSKAQGEKQKPEHESPKSDHVFFFCFFFTNSKLESRPKGKLCCAQIQFFFFSELVLQRLFLEVLERT